MDRTPTTPAADRRKQQRRAPWHGVIPFVASALLCAGCATNVVATYDELVAAIKAGKDVDAGTLRAAFVAAPDFPERLQEISTLETQAIHLIEEEPLRLGPLGSAIVDQYPGSLTGHHALATFYSYLEREDTAAGHRERVNRIRASIDDGAKGTLESPLPVISPAEPNAYLFATGRTPVGSMYLPLDRTPLLLKVAAKPAEGPIENVYFDLDAVYAGWLREAQEDDEFHPDRVIFPLARAGDSAAQTFLGSLRRDQDMLDESIDLLARASRSGNLIAHLMLARAYWSRAVNAPSGPGREAAQLEVVRNYELGIDIGSDEAMFELGRLYAWGVYGSELRDRGLGLIDQAADLDNSAACLFLARWFEASELPAQSDYDRSERYYLRAASLDNVIAKIDYARFLMREDIDKAFSDQAYRWLTGIANDGAACEDLRVPCADARVQLGNLFAKGVHVRRNYRKARSWFRSAVAVSPEHARIVNDVAWTLTVSNLERLRDERYALQIMDHVMTENESARGEPAYIDTWAAAYAANGDFERAIELQREALDEANAQQIDDDTIGILREHLQAFEAGRTIIELIP